MVQSIIALLLCCCCGWLVESFTSNGTNCYGRSGKEYPTVYWINLDSKTERRAYMENQFSKIHINHHRISAITDNSSEFRLGMLEKPCKRNTDKDIAVILSHLKAIHTAVYSPRRKSVLDNYALILEDDVKFLYDIDFMQLIKSAPESFGILQLVTSNIEAIQLLWDSYQEVSRKKGQSQKLKIVNDWGRFWNTNKWTDKTKNGKYPLYWSAQAYLIDKRVVKPFIDDVVDITRSGGKSKSRVYKIVNSFHSGGCKRTHIRPCVLANCKIYTTVSILVMLSIYTCILSIPVMPLPAWGTSSWLCLFGL